MSQPAGGAGGGRHPAGRQVHPQRGRVVDQPGRVLDGAGEVPPVLSADGRDGDGAAEAVEAPDESVGGRAQVGQAGVSPGEGQWEVTFRGLTGHPGPAGQTQVRPELERNNLGRENSSSARQLEDTEQDQQVTSSHHHHHLISDICNQLSFQITGQFWCQLTINRTG